MLDGGSIMSSTTIHLPDPLLVQIDKVVKEEGMSRNRFIMKACKEALKNIAGKWPASFFDEELAEEDRLLLKEAAEEIKENIISNRKNRKGSDL